MTFQTPNKQYTRQTLVSLLYVSVCHGLR